MSVDDVAGMVGDAVELRIAARLTDTDGSETLAVRVSGMPEEASLSVGQRQPDGAWLLAANELEDVKLHLPSSSDADFVLEIAAIATDGNGDEAIVVQELKVRVDAPVEEDDRSRDRTEDSDDFRSDADIERDLDDADRLVQASFDEALLQGIGNVARNGIGQTDQLLDGRTPIPDGYSVGLGASPSKDWSHVDFGEVHELEGSAKLNDDPDEAEGRIETAERPDQLASTGESYSDSQANEARGLAWFWSLVRAYGGMRTDHSNSADRDEQGHRPVPRR